MSHRPREVPRCPRAAPFSVQGCSNQDTLVKTVYFSFLEFRSDVLGEDDEI